MTLKYLFLYILSFPLTVYCQNIPSNELTKMLSYGIGNQTAQLEMTLNEANARNAQCFPKFFATADLTLSNGSSIKGLNVKFDFGEKVLLIRKENSILIGAPNLIKRVDFEAPELNDLINVNQMGRTYGKQGFYTILAQSKDNYLLKYLDLTIVKKASEASINANEIYTPVEEEPVILVAEEILLFKNRELFILPNFKTKTLEDLNESIKELKAFIKAEKLKYKNEADLIKFANYFLSL